MERTHRIEIWFFIGSLLFVYGILILGAGLYHLVHPPLQQFALADLHVDIWWGGVAVDVGISLYSQVLAAVEQRGESNEQDR